MSFGWSTFVVDLKHFDMDNKTKYRITCTEEQMRMISNAVEDWSRFLAGQTEMWHATSMLDNHSDLQVKMAQLQHLVTPDLPRGASYSWNGGHCPNDKQRKAIAMSYGVYREILHYLTVKDNIDNVYASATLTCPEQGDLIKIEVVGDE